MRTALIVQILLLVNLSSGITKIMKILVLVSAILVAVSAQGYRPQISPDYDYNPIPYSFNYKADTEDGGSSSHEESGDGSGTVRGSYTVNNLEGHVRVVEYEAGPNGFTAVVRTNEPGTDNSFPANVIFESTAPEARGPVIRYSNDQRYSAPEPARYSPPSPNAVTGGQGRQNTRYVLVPSTDPRAAGRS